MSRRALVGRVKVGVLVVLLVATVSSVLWFDGGGDVVLQAIVVVGAVVLGIEAVLDSAGTSHSKLGGVVLVAAGTYGGWLAVRGVAPLESSVLSVAFIVGVVLSVQSRSATHAAS